MSRPAARDNAAQHYRIAETYASQAAMVRGPNDHTPVFPAWTDHCIRMSHLHLELAKSAEHVLLSFDGRRDPDDRYLEDDAGWPPIPGDVWRDSSESGSTWAAQGDGRLHNIESGAYANPETLREQNGAMRLVFRPYVPSAFDMECPF